MRSLISLAAAIVAAGAVSITASPSMRQAQFRTTSNAEVYKAGPAAQDRCTWLGINFSSQSSQSINNTFSEYYPEGSNPSLELLVARYPANTLPATFLKDLQKTLSDVGPDIDITADAGYGKSGGRSGSNGPLGGLPAFCRFGGNLATSALTSVLFEVWLPLASNLSIPLAPINSTDYPTNSTPVVLSRDGKILKGPPYLVQMPVNGTLSSNSTTSASVPASTATAASTSASSSTAVATTTSTATMPSSANSDAVSRSSSDEERGIIGGLLGGFLGLPLSGNDVFGQPKSFDGWNGRLLYIGNGGQRGFVPLTDLKQQMSRHRFAVAGSDAGHFSTTGGTSWALGPQVNDSARDWASRATHVARQASLEVVDLFYGASAGVRVKGEPNPSKLSTDRLRAYYVGCSVGGMQGFGSVQNYPEDFDAVLAGAPAIYFNRVNHGQIHTQNRHRASVAGPGFFDIKLLITSVRKLVLDQCDGLDGLKDGVINQAYTCTPDFSPLLCGSNSTYGNNFAACFNSTQLADLQELFRDTIYNDTGVPTFIYDRYLPGLDISASALTGAAAKAVGWITNAILQNQTAPGFNAYTNETVALFQRGEHFNPGGSNTDNPDISAFLSGGKRKLIHYHGLGDLTISPAASIRYYNEVAQTVQGKAGLKSLSDSYRFFGVPGMSHCRNGPGAFLFGAPTQNDAGNTPLRWDTEHDIILSLVAWAEHGDAFAPKYQVGAAWHSVTADIPGNPALGPSVGASDTNALPTTYWSRLYGLRNTRKLCPWPQVAQYNGFGNPNGTQGHRSFSCRDP